MSFLEIYQQLPLFKHRSRLKGKDEIMASIQGKKVILKELEEIFKQNEDRLSYDRIMLYLEQDQVQSVSIKKKMDPVHTTVKTYFPVIEMKDGTEHIILFPSDKIRENKTLRQAFLDAAYVCKMINQLWVRKADIHDKKPRGDNE